MCFCGELELQPREGDAKFEAPVKLLKLVYPY